MYNTIIFPPFGVSGKEKRDEFIRSAGQNLMFEPEGRVSVLRMDKSFFLHERSGGSLVSPLLPKVEK